MHRNILLSPKTAASIDAQVQKLLKDLGNPKPPLDLRDVRTLLKLDLNFYSTADTSWLNEKIHQMKVAGKQVLSEPTSLITVVKSLALKGVLLVEQRRILLDTGHIHRNPGKPEKSRNLLGVAIGETRRERLATFSKVRPGRPADPA